MLPLRSQGLCLFLCGIQALLSRCASCLHLQLLCCSVSSNRPVATLETLGIALCHKPVSLILGPEHRFTQFCRLRGSSLSFHCLRLHLSLINMLLTSGTA